MSARRVPLPPLLGPYEVCAKIAGGGMATIHLGKRVGTEDDLVAIKVMSDEYYDNAAFVDMFLDEARILKKLSHPNVIHTHDYGSVGPHRYIAMELLLGRPLVDAWEICAKEKTRIPLTLGAWICARVAEGVHSAHELKDDDGELLGVIHRDVNPSNVFLLYDGRVKLIDFGLAKAKRRKATSEEGIVKGKIPYLAPEQAKLAPLDRRVDVYSLGITLWELGTGKRLFKRENDMATIAAIRKAEVPDPRDIVLAYPDALYRIVERALKADPEERYATAQELQFDLDGFVREHAETDMKASLETYMREAFAGEETRQRDWLRRATSRQRDFSRTMPPPVPVPDAATLYETNFKSSMPPPLALTMPPESASLTDLMIPSAPNLPSGISSGISSSAPPPVVTTEATPSPSAPASAPVTKTPPPVAITTDPAPLTEVTASQPVPLRSKNKGTSAIEKKVPNKSATLIAPKSSTSGLVVALIVVVLAASAIALISLAR